MAVDGGGFGVLSLAVHLHLLEFLGLGRLGGFDGILGLGFVVGSGWGGGFDGIWVLLDCVWCWWWGGSCGAVVGVLGWEDFFWKKKMNGEEDDVR